MKDEVYVTRKADKISEEWATACIRAGKSVDDKFLVNCTSGHNYRLYGIPGLWYMNTFDIVPDILWDTKTKTSMFEEQANAVVDPKHYDMMGVNTIEILAAAMTKKEWRGFCLGNTLKYRIRAGKKDDLQQDIDKANNYERLYEEHKHLCRKGKKKAKG